MTNNCLDHRPTHTAFVTRNNVEGGREGGRGGKGGREGAERERGQGEQRERGEEGGVSPSTCNDE